MRTYTLILGLLLVVGCAVRPGRHSPGPREAGRPPTDRSAVTVFDHNRHTIEFDGVTLRVVPAWYGGGPWARELTAAERAFLCERVERVARLPLQAKYEDPDIWDGSQLYFELRAAGLAVRHVAVSNVFVEDLAALTDALDVLLPPEHRVRYREWKEDSDAAAEGPG